VRFRRGWGIEGGALRQLIIRVSDQLKAGEIRLIDCTPEERLTDRFVFVIPILSEYLECENTFHKMELFYPEQR
jgi:hypothetical protein